ncbi:hypothetical protein D7Y05_03670 [bacterium 1XD42-54]|nr:hypothetical protein D7Y05_03670 [bacterium 1XD42-54]
MRKKKAVRLMAVLLSGAMLLGNAPASVAMEGEIPQENVLEELILEDDGSSTAADEGNSGEAEEKTELGIESIETVNDPVGEEEPPVEGSDKPEHQEAEIRAGAQQILMFTMEATAENITVAWRSSDSTVAECGTIRNPDAAKGETEYSCIVTGKKAGMCTIEAYNESDSTVYAAFDVSIVPYRVTGCIGTQLAFTITSEVLQEFDFSCVDDALTNATFEAVDLVNSGGQTIYVYSYRIDADKLYDGVLKATGKTDQTQKEVSVTVSSHSWSDTPTVEKEATCSEPGVQNVHCTVCDAVKEGSEEEIPCIPHTWNPEATIEKEATCSEPGYQVTYCSDCGAAKEGSREEIPCIPHTWNPEATIEKEATCSATGYKSVHCSVCDAVKAGSEETIPSTPHSWKTDRTVDQPVTCTENGASSIHCSVCDIVKEGSVQQLPATGHQWDSWKQVTAPAIKTEGKDQRVCLRCNAKETRSTGKLPLALDKVKMNTPTVVSGDHIGLSWQAVNYADGYIVYRKKGSKWTKIATLKGNVLAYTDKDTKIGTTYTYSVRGYVTENGKTVYSPSLKPGVSIEQKFYKDAVKMRDATDLSTTSIKIRWTGRKKSSGYIIYRKIPGKSWKKLATVGKVTSYTDKTCDSATTYQYAVKAYTKNGKKTIYSKMEKTGAAAISRMHRPKVTVKSTDEETAVLKWTKQSNVGGYVIYRKEGSKGKWIKIKRTSAKTSSFTDEDVESGKTYYYIVKAYKKAKPKVGIMEPVYSKYYKKKVKIK